MKSAKTMIRISGILLFLRVVLFLGLGLILYFDDEVFGLIFLVLSVIFTIMPVTLFILCGNDNRIVKSKTCVLVFAILSIFQNIIAAKNLKK